MATFCFPDYCLVFFSGSFFLFFAGYHASADTPGNTLVQARSLDDIISFDPAEVFEIGAAEIVGNSYERLVAYDPEDGSRINGVLAESWRISTDGKTVFFKIREGHRFASGHAVTALDVVFSLRRAVLLDKTPSFILTQFGIDASNIDTSIKQIASHELSFTMSDAFSLPFLLSCLTTTVASVVDSKLVMLHEENGDLGHSWLKSNHAGSGPFIIREWHPQEVVIMDRNENYAGVKAPLKHIIYRHVSESSMQRLLLEKGDVDVARGLGVEDLAMAGARHDIDVVGNPGEILHYISMNQKNDILSNPDVLQALKHLIDYRAIVDVFTGGRGHVHQSFLPSGIFGSIDDTPYDFNVEKALAYLSAAGYPDGFSVIMDVRNSMPFIGIAEAIQRSFAEGGVQLELRLSDHKRLLTRYRARQHDMVLAYWGVHYRDPHMNAQAFAFNPDDGDTSQFRTLAWRNSWDTGSLNARVDRSIRELNAEKRAASYRAMQRDVMRHGPFIIIYQAVETIAMRSDIHGFVPGMSPDSNDFSRVHKD